MNFEKLTKEEAELYSYTDLTEMILKNCDGKNTLELFTMIIEKLELGKAYLEDKIGDYYTLLSSNKKFIIDGGIWDLKERKKSTEIKQIKEEIDFDIEELEEDLLDENDFEFDDELDDEENFEEDIKHIKIYQDEDEE